MFAETPHTVPDFKASRAAAHPKGNKAEDLGKVRRRPSETRPLNLCNIDNKAIACAANLFLACLACDIVHP
eukprot:9487274-Pyramimonas_sp.AAC.1